MARRQSKDPLERYDTPAWVTRALIKHGPVQGWHVIEPCAGAGAMVDVLVEADCIVAAFDIEPRRDDITQLDTCMPGIFEQIRLGYGADLALITNPPFSRASEYQRRGALFRRTALLVRLSWLERTRDRLDVPDPVRLIVLPRPRFIGRGEDMVTVAWACWGDWAPGIIRLSRKDCEGLDAPAFSRPRVVLPFRRLEVPRR